MDFHGDFSIKIRDSMEIELTSLGKAWMGQPAKNGDLYAAGTSGETLDGYFGILIVWILLV